MGTLMTAYLVVWLAVVLYAARLGARQRQLTRDLEALERRLDRSASLEDQTFRAA